MKNRIILLSLLFCLLYAHGVQGQTNNAVSIYEGAQITAVEFEFTNQPADTSRFSRIRQEVESLFPIHPYMHFNRMQIEYYLSQIRNLSFVQAVDAWITPESEGGLKIVVEVALAPPAEGPKGSTNIFREITSFPVIYSKGSNFLTLRLTGAEIAFSNDNAWFGQPLALLAGNPLAESPAGRGYTGWVEGFGMGGVYGITRIIPRWNLHLYGGASYLMSFSAGRELFTDRSRFHGGVEDAYLGVVGGDQLGGGRDYSYNVVYGRKSFVLGNGWLVVNTSMNGHDRAALQLNARNAARRLFLAGFRRGGSNGSLTAQLFQLRPDELPIVDSHTVLDGANLEWNHHNRLQFGASVLYVPQSDFGYYLPDGTRHTRKGLWVYNLRFFGNPAQDRPSVFFKTEVGYQRNRYFDMRALAGYAQVGYNFSNTSGKPSLSYRFAYFPGDNPDTKTYERWDPLYTGGNGEQWVQGSNMYKVVQNSNEMTHMVQLVYTPFSKWQTVTQVWFFAAPQKNNLGGNPGLSLMESKYYGTELNFTLKYFHSRRWYFHLNTALTLPGRAIRQIVPGSKQWFSLMFFARYSI